MSTVILHTQHSGDHQGDASEVIWGFTAAWASSITPAVSARRAHLGKHHFAPSYIVEYRKALNATRPEVPWL